MQHITIDWEMTRFFSFSWLATMMLHGADDIVRHGSKVVGIEIHRQTRARKSRNPERFAAHFVVLAEAPSKLWFGTPLKTTFLWQFENDSLFG